MEWKYAEENVINIGSNPIVGEERLKQESSFWILENLEANAYILYFCS